MVAKSVGILVIGLAVVSASPSQASEQRSAFLCLLFERQLDRSASEPPSAQSSLRRLYFLLAGPAEEVEPDATIETFDPTGMLNGAHFSRFVRGDRERLGEFAVLTGTPLAASTFMLVLFPKTEASQFTAGLAVGSGGRARFTGRCLHIQNENTAAEFEWYKAHEGH